MTRTVGQKLSIKQEKRTAKKYGGTRTPQSGAGWAHKNDVRTDRFLIENKTTSNKSSISLKAKDLEGVTRNAIVSGRDAVLQFDLNGRRYVVLNEDDFIELAGLDQ